MRYFFTALISIIFANQVFAASDQIITFQSMQLPGSVKKSVLEGEVFARSNVNTEDDGKMQKLDYDIAAMHSKSCLYSLRKISLYEKFKDFISFVTSSSYDEKSKRIDLTLSSKLLPFDMRLNFEIDRIKKPGIYDFYFDKGFLKGLKGKIHVSEYKKRCHIYSKVKWHGPHSGIPNVVFEVFSATLGRLAMEKLFRLSSTY